MKEELEGSSHGSQAKIDKKYSKVPPLRNCIIRNSDLILVNKIPVYKKLSRLIHVQFLLQWYIVIFYGIFLNMAPISLSSLEIRMKVLSPNYYNFKKLSVLTQTISFLFNCAYLKKRFLNNFDSCLEYKSVSYTMVYTPCFEEIYSNIRNQSGCFCEMSFL